MSSSMLVLPPASVAARVTVRPFLLDDSDFCDLTDEGMEAEPVPARLRYEEGVPLVAGVGEVARGCPFGVEELEEVWEGGR